MKKNHLITLAAATLFTISSVGNAAMSKEEYKSAKEQISTKYGTDKTACKLKSGNARDICMQEAKGSDKIAKAELEQGYAPTTKHLYDVRISKVNSTYAIAKQKCDDLAGNPKDVCRKEAKSAMVAGKADAKLTEKTTDANSTAREKTSDARKSANTDKRDAAYAVVREKCDALAGDAKANCIRDAKLRFNQN